MSYQGPTKPAYAGAEVRFQIHRPDAGHPGPEVMARRRAELAAEAQRLMRRRHVSMSLANRTRAGVHGMNEMEAHQIATRALRRATERHSMFLRTVERLIEFGGFNEARTLVRASRERKNREAESENS